MSRKQILLLILGIPFVMAASERGYQGDGKFSELTRTYIPVVGVTRGYTITMPRFSTESAVSVTNSLAGLPRINQGFNVEVAIYMPEKQLPLEEARKVDTSVPETHEIHCVLFDRKAKRIVQEHTGKVSALPATASLHFQLSPFVKHVLGVSFTDVKEDAELEIRLEYKTNGVPLKRQMMIIVVNDAPTA